MNHLTRNDYAGALRLLAGLEAESVDVDVDVESFARAVVNAVTGFVASEMTTLSVCELVSGERRGIGPDSLSRPEFQRTALYADYYQRVGLDHAVAVPLMMDGLTLVSIVLNRRGLDFSERDRERLELLRPHLAYIYRQACLGQSGPTASNASLSWPPAEPDPIPAALTQREGEVMHWLSRGKTDAEIAVLLAISPRTVHKHLEHIYVKLGVETRTAAVMRARAMAPAAHGASH